MTLKKCLTFYEECFYEKEAKSQSTVKAGLEPGPVVPNSLSPTTTLPHRPAKNSEKKLSIKFTNKLSS